MKTQRIRDPIHDLIVFDDDGRVDGFAWELLHTPDVQRLRRIKQLGVSEFVFPSASHNQFAHSIGVFNNARRLVQLIEREIKLNRVSGKFDLKRAKVALFAALLHDIGHGPFSHAFEEARKAIAGERAGSDAAKQKIRKHEVFTADMILDPSGQIGEILSRAKVNAQDVADIIREEIPRDMYHAVVSSSFDADRLDYIIRDRYMTGVGAGAIDLEWMMDNVRVALIDVSPPETTDEAPDHKHSFCLGYKARDAAEDFLLARYRLYANVYFHKATRGFEQLVSAFFRHLARAAREKGRVDGLADEHPLVRFFVSDKEEIANYRALDDTVVWGALHAIAKSGEPQIKRIASNILNRVRPFCVDIQLEFPDAPEKQRRLKHSLEQRFKSNLGESVFRDSARLSLYGAIGADDERAQRRLMIQMKDKTIKEITDFKDATIAGSDRQRMFERYYFLNSDEFKLARNVVNSVQRRHR